MKRLINWLTAWYERRDFDKAMRDGTPVELVGNPRVIKERPRWWVDSGGFVHVRPTSTMTTGTGQVINVQWKDSA